MTDIAQFLTELEAIAFIDSLVWRGKCPAGNAFIEKDIFDGRYHVYLMD